MPPWKSLSTTAHLLTLPFLFGPYIRSAFFLLCPYAPLMVTLSTGILLSYALLRSFFHPLPLPKPEHELGERPQGLLSGDLPQHLRMGN